MNDTNSYVSFISWLDILKARRTLAEARYSILGKKPLKAKLREAGFHHCWGYFIRDGYKVRIYSSSKKSKVTGMRNTHMDVVRPNDMYTHTYTCIKREDNVLDIIFKP